MAFTFWMKHVMKKYGTMAVFIHAYVSCATTTGLYIAIDNNADVGISPSVSVEAPPALVPSAHDEILHDAVGSVPNRSEVVL
jgi:hypothetical protein